MISLEEILYLVMILPVLGYFIYKIHQLNNSDLMKRD